VALMPYADRCFPQEGLMLVTLDKHVCRSPDSRRSQDLAVSSRIRSQACCAASPKGQWARKLITGPNDGGGGTSTAGAAGAIALDFVVAVVRISVGVDTGCQAPVPP
jgi:hypothetical protein